MDNDGIIDVEEMASIMETMECLEFKDHSHVVTTTDDLSPLDRAQNLFNCLEHENEGSLTKEEFIAGYLERNVLMEKQDTQEQRIRYEGFFILLKCISN